MIIIFFFWVVVVSIPSVQLQLMVACLLANQRTAFVAYDSEK